FIYQGFNADEQGARVFDGAIPHIAGSRKTFTNYRFAQPGRYSRQHEDHDFPGDQFPFSYAETTDPLSGGSGSILSACSASDTCPKIMHTDTSTEFWQARAALVSTSPSGEPLEMPDNVRLYYLSGLPHFTGWQSVSSESPVCRFPTNPISSAPIMRALLASMRGWVADNKTPPASR
ncbi:alpha/beta hydrolase domain-containing protein, partial [Lutimaribacter sp. EGI FJ00014]|nr:alpha/beta hydrolase domain-containing protein [Lutimaribacter sp. EGI FJ00014]